MFARPLRYCFFLAQLLLAVAYFGYWGADRFEVKHAELPADTLKGAGPLKIAFFSDLHSRKDHFETVVEEVEKAKPDLILFGGDFVWALGRFGHTRWAVEGLKKLCAVAPVYAMLGNQDYEMLPEVERIFSTAGVTLLRNQATDWTAPNGTVIRLVGLGDWTEGDENPAACLSEGDSEEKPVLLLSHDPESRHLLGDYDWDLMLSGHTHGGQLGIPFTDKYLCFRSDMPCGLYPYDRNRRIYVSKGIGGSMGMRFFCTPELVILEQK